jgi:two-component system sensor histidine kinase MtrB
MANLVDNARKYGGGTPVRLAVREEVRGAERRAVVVVSDGGAGFSPEELPHVFEPFYRGQNARGRETGYGLGLALAKRVVEVHGGEISAANQPDGGARVELRLPIAPAEV